MEEYGMKHLSLTRLSDVLKQKRSEKSITQEQLCEKTGINRNMIGRIERMTYIPTIPQLEKLAEVLSFDIEELFVDDNKPGVYTAFRGNHMTPAERKGTKRLMDMMVAAKQQIILRKALQHEM